MLEIIRRVQPEPASSGEVESREARAGSTGRESTDPEIVGPPFSPEQDCRYNLTIVAEIKICITLREGVHGTPSEGVSK
ncbi:hypothetical protein AGOR_G00169570 [Albula goreensis]|uniref:Uncharacterized protein n=1 Tax=Albula goreensis TaxID=1534307 RepID=A0A8T3D308_9TELE|nr:hypothetical protein AGOR_G00169570 [Albula goreensis]